MSSSSQVVPAIPISSSPSTAHHSFSVKLTPKNYLAWKTQFIPLLNYHNLNHLINGSTPPSKIIMSSSNPPSEIPNPEYDSWYKKDQMLHSWILSSLTEEIFPYVIGLQSANEVWNALAQAFGSISQNRQLQLHIELQELKKNDLSVSTYLQRAKALKDELQSAGRTLSTAKFSSTGLLLTQQKYIQDLLTQHHMSSCKPCSTPMATTPTLSKFAGAPLSTGEQFRQLVGALQYITLTRPDVAFSVNKLAQFMHQPTQEHWLAAKRLLCYLQGTSAMGLFFSKNSSFSLQCFTDSDWAGCPDDRRSTSGYAIYLGHNLISWSSKKQPTIARSSTESEYRSIAHATFEIMWLQSLLSELGFSVLPSTLWCDNVGAISLSSNPVFHARTKYIELDYHFVREQVQLKKIQVHFVSSDDQIADIMTKPLGQRLFLHHRDKLRLLQPPSSA